MTNLLRDLWTGLVAVPDPNPDVLLQIEAVLASHERMAIRWRLGTPRSLAEWYQQHGRRISA